MHLLNLPLESLLVALKSVHVLSMHLADAFLDQIGLRQFALLVLHLLVDLPQIPSPQLNQVPHRRLLMTPEDLHQLLIVLSQCTAHHLGILLDQVGYCLALTVAVDGVEPHQRTPLRQVAQSTC